MKWIVVPIPGMLVIPLLLLALAVAALCVLRALMRRDRQALGRYGREVRKIALWVTGFAALMVVLIGLR